MSRNIGRLKEEILTLLEEDREFRYAVAGLIGLSEILRSLDSLQEQVAENTKAIRVLQEQVADNTRAIRSLQEQVLSLTRIMEQFSRRLDALGARWGILSEAAFRNSMRGILERHFEARVERWIYYDREGFVYGHPSTVDADLVIKDKEHILIEVKSSVRKSDVTELKRVGELYEKVKGVKPRLIIVSPYVDEKARETAEALGIEMYTSIE